MPRELAGRLLDPLREHFGGDPGIEVIAERRQAERRLEERRGPVDEAERSRRRVRAETGRRVAERRTEPLAVPIPALPRKAARHADRLTFVSRRMPSEQAARDVETERLVLRFQGGETAAVGELYLRHFDTVYGYSRLALRDQQRAEQATQRAFTLATRTAAEYEGVSGLPFRALLLRIAREVILEAMGTRPAGATATEDLTSAELRTGLGSEPALEWLSDQDVAFFVERLPDYQREVIVLRYLLGESSERAAKVLEVPVEEVREMLSRALVTLEGRLREIGRAPRPGAESAPMVMRRRALPVLAARRGSLAAELHPGGATATRPILGRA